VGILVVAALALWLAPRVVEGPAQNIRHRPLRSFGLGILGLVGFVLLVPALTAVAMLAMVGLRSVGLGALGATVVAAMTVALVGLGFLLFVVLAYGAPAGVGMALGTVLMRDVPTDPTARRWWPLVIGVVVVVIVTSVPVVGGWIGMVPAGPALLGLGASLLALRARPVPQATGAPEPLPHR
jgi:hypothetical protein